MYKKLLMATAVASISVGTAQAATWSNLGTYVPVMPIHTHEGAQSTLDSAGGVNVGERLIELGAEYALNDLITFTLNTPKASGSFWPTTVAGLQDNLAAGSLVKDGSISDADANIIIEGAGNNIANNTGFSVGQRIRFATSGATCYTIKTIDGGGSIGITPALSTAATLPADDDAITSCAAGGAGTYKDIDLTLVAGSATAGQYRVSALGIGTTSVGSVIITPAVNVTAAGLKAAGKATMSFSATTATGTAMDALATSATLGTSKPQWTQTVTKFDGIIDVGAAKKKYTTGNSDAVSIKHAEIVGTAASILPAITANGVISHTGAITALAATATSVVNTLSGDFSYLDDTAATTGVQISAGAGAADELNTTGTGCTGAVSTAGVLTVTDDISDSAAACVATVTNTQASVLPGQSFTNTAKYTFTSVGGNPTTASAAAKSAGAWTLNGATVRAYGVPMGSHVSRFIWINNKGALDGAFNYTATMNGSSYGPFPLGTVPAKKSMSVGGLVDTDLSARGITIAPSSRATISFSAPVKQADIVVSASYKHIADADRVALETSDSLNATGK